MICRHRRGYLGPASLRRGQLGSRFPLCAFFFTQDNQIHTEGAKSLARALKTNLALVSVNLRYFLGPDALIKVTER